MLTLYAIPNCDTVKKARKWLADRDIDYRFHDYKKADVPEEKLRDWVAQRGWEAICNKRGMTWRKLSDEQKVGITDDASAIALMVEQPSVIKRPIIEGAGELVIGFDEAAYQSVFLEK